MKGLIIASLGALAFGSAAQAATDTRQASEAPAFEPVNSFYIYGGLHDFDVIDEDTLILWPNAFDPYLVELRGRSHDLKFAHVIAVESSLSRVHSKFDSVLVRGFRYPIDQIYKLSREAARELKKDI